MRRPRSCVLALLAAGTLAGCEVDDREIGAAAAKQIDEQVTPLADPAAQAAMQKLGDALVRASGDTNYQWRFRVVVDSSINAFALPGGFVYVHTALIARAGDVDELGGVVGHEVAHAVLRHGAEQAEKGQIGTAILAGVCLFTGWCDGGLASVAINVGTTAVMSKFSRGDELEADSAGVQYAARAGLDPRGVTRFFKKLEAERGDSPAILQFLSTHPMEADRIARVESLVAAGAARRVGSGAPTATPKDSLVAWFALLQSRSSAPR